MVKIQGSLACVRSYILSDLLETVSSEVVQLAYQFVVSCFTDLVMLLLHPINFVRLNLSSKSLPVILRCSFFLSAFSVLLGWGMEPENFGVMLKTRPLVAVDA
jgi:hypothetical protein